MHNNVTSSKFVDCKQNSFCKWHNLLNYGEISVKHFNVKHSVD